MAYKIALATSDGTSVDTTFGACGVFSVYDVSDDGSFSFAEQRTVPSDVDSGTEQSSGGCSGGGSGCGGGHGGCGAGAEVSEKVLALADCRAVVAAKIGFCAVKQLEKKAIASFDVECGVTEALEKITGYFFKLDNHISLAKK